MKNLQNFKIAIFGFWTKKIQENVEGTRAYVKFLDQRGNTVAEGTLSTTSPNNMTFTQNTNSVLLPMNAQLYLQVY